MTLILVGSALFVGIMTVIVAYLILFKQITSQAEQQVEQVFDAVEYSSAIAAYSGNKEIANDVVRGVIRNAFVSDVTIKNNQSLNVALKKTTSTTFTHQKIIKRELKSPFDDNEVVGQLEASLYEPEIASRAQRAATILGSSLGFMVLIIAALLWVAVSKLITNPLFNLSNKLHAIQPGTHERLTSVTNYDDELGLLTKDINALLDLTESTLLEERTLRKQIEDLEKQYQTVFEHARTGITLLNRDGSCVLANPVVGQIIGMKDSSVEGTFSLKPNWFEDIFEDSQAFISMLNSSFDENITLTKDFKLKNSVHNTTSKWINITMSQHPRESDLLLIECMLFDISERKSREEKTFYLANHDQLTNISNRRAAESWIQNRISNQDSGYLMLIDLDRFKHINDTWGHDAGDKVLVEASRRMQDMVRKDHDLVARLGGDEFLICMSNFSDLSTLQIFLHKLINNINQSIDLGNANSDYVGASIGVVKYPDQSSELTTLLNIADIGMYKVKNAGRNGFSIYNGHIYDTVNISHLENES